MPRSIYAEINLHITWHTKDGATPIHGEVETRLHGYLRNRVVETDGVRFHAVGGLEDHVHLAVSIPPTLLVSEWIGGLKGASAHYVNHEVADRKVLEWQSGYGVVSFGTKDLAWRRLKPLLGKPVETGWRMFRARAPGAKAPGYDPPAAGEAV
jgi:REP element-mobilizing transposase RayT